MSFNSLQPSTPVLSENTMQSITSLTNYIQNVVDHNTNDKDVPEVWSPELWHPDSKTGKIKKHSLGNEKKSPVEEPTTTKSECEQPSYNLPSSTFLPLSEEENEIEENSQTIVS